MAKHNKAAVAKHVGMMRVTIGGFQALVDKLLAANEQLVASNDMLVASNEKLVDTSEKQQAINKDLSKRLAYFEEKEKKEVEKAEKEEKERETLNRYDENQVPKTVTAKFKFDLNGSKKYVTLSENGTRVLGNSSTQAVVSTTGFSSGVHIWKMKGNGLHWTCHHSIGVMTHTKVKDGKCLWQNDPTVYCYRSAYTSISKNSTNLVSSLPPWQVGEVVTIVLDCQKWKMYFWKNETRLGAIDIEKGKTYYPAFACCSCSKKSDFKLIVA